MQTLYRRMAGKSASLAAGAIFCGLIAWPAMAAQTVTIDGRELLTRMQRMERDIRDLQAETFRRPPGAIADAPPPPSNAGVPGDVNPILRRMDEFGDSIAKLTGQMEELSHQVDLLSQKADRLQKEMDYQAQQAAQAQPGGPNGGPPDNAGGSEPPAGNAVASLAPPDRRQPGPDQPASGVLGTIPEGARLPAPPPPGPNPKAEFDGAMGLLSRAQYDQATQAFRNFADAYPDDERASAALYYKADITYSIKKDYGEAARDFAELLKKYPKAPRAPEGMVKLGEALIELGQTKEGCATLAALPAQYPAVSPAIATRARNDRRDNKCR